MSEGPDSAKLGRETNAAQRQGKQPEQQTSQPERSQRPTHHAFSVREDADGNSHFNRIGAAFRHKDAKGYTIDLSATPVDGRVVLRSPLERLDAQRQGERPSVADRDRSRDE
ncbi:hypothetical protein AWH62_12820 [Maricaulis sp. W15]|uniref:hypothetical protein n=1 Tax=Maricaulis sp. W15 TaxID=1772333 RepID=UPI00095DEC1F|nr:hypothetical protein [Maricaulis sp. W15]OLF71423.1 hypothetical protein AWH62_12820 [Maricaulis sp. W15]